MALAVLTQAWPADAQTGYYSSGTSVSLGYTAVSPGSSSADLLHVAASINDDLKVYTFTMDTGSVGVLLGSGVWKDPPKDAMGGPGVLTYTSSNRVESGHYYTVSLKLRDENSNTVAVARIPVLRVEQITDLLGNVTSSSPMTEMMGVGFARVADGQPTATADKNPFINLTAIANAAGTLSAVPVGFNSGYVVSSTRVQLGLTAANTASATAIKLLADKDPMHNVPGHQEWQAVPVTFTVNGASVPGTILVDTGVTTGYTKSTVGDFKDGASLPRNTRIDVTFTGSGGSSLAGYSLINRDMNDPQSPTDGVYVSANDQTQPLPVPFLNTSLSFLNGANIFYDPVNGYYGVMANGQVDAKYLSVTPGLILQGALTLPTGFASSLPVVLQAPTSIAAGTGNAGWSGTVSGLGSLTLTGGTLNLTGVNTYAGGTTVTGGVLGISSDAALGALSGDLNLSGGTLRVLGSLTSARGITLSGSGGVIDTNGMSVRLNGAIGGAGGLALMGGGTLTLTGTNSYMGGTAVGGGVLEVANDASLGASTGALALQGGTLRNLSGLTTSRTVLLGGPGGTVDTNGQAVEIDGTVAGSGSLDVTGGGRLTLMGVNSFTGPVSVSNGSTLAVGSDAALGNASNALSLDASTLSAAGTLMSARPVTLTNGAQVNTGGNGVGLSGTISGSGGLVVSGGGALALAGTNSFKGGVAVNGSTLAVTSDAALGDANNTVTLTNATLAALAPLSSARTLVLAGTGGGVDTGGVRVSLSGAVNGSGTLLVTGGGTLALTGINGFTGNVAVNGATLIAGSDTVLGDPSNRVLLGNATLRALNGLSSARAVSVAAGSSTIDNGGATTILSGTVSGSGTLVAAGSGTTVLSGMQVQLGGLVAQAGQLRIDGAVAAGSLTVQQSATLRGTGYIAAPTTVVGTLAPGNSPGTLTFAQSVTLQPGAALSLDVDGPGLNSGAGNHSVVAVTNGTFTAAGTLVPVLRGITGDATNAYTPVLGTTLSAVAAPGGVSGSFTGITQPATGLPAGTRFDALYSPTTVSLVVTPSAYGNLMASGLAPTGNETSVGTAIDALRGSAGVRPSGTVNPLLNNLYSLSAASIPSALDGLGGKIYGDAFFAGLEQQRLVAGAVSEQLASLRGAALGARTQVAAAGWGGTVWVRALGGWTDLNSDARANGAGATLSGVAVGADMRRDNLVAGMTLAYTGASVSSRDGGQASTQAVHAALYGGWQQGLLFADALAGGTSAQDDVRRMISVTGTTARGKSGTDGAFGTARVGMRFDVAGARIEPALAFSGQGLSRGRTREGTDSLAALSVTGNSVRSLRSELGVRINRNFDVLGRTVVPNAHLGWSHEYSDTTTAVTASFANLGGPTFATSTAAFGRDGLVGGVGVATALAPRLSVFAGYDADVRSWVTVQAVSGGLQYAW